MGRTGDAGDEIGSQLLAAWLVHDIMLLCFLLERTYAPYPKWFGAAFAWLECAPQLMPILRRVLGAPTCAIPQNFVGGYKHYGFARQLHPPGGSDPPGGFAETQKLFLIESYVLCSASGEAHDSQIDWHSYHPHQLNRCGLEHCRNPKSAQRN